MLISQDWNSFSSSLSGQHWKDDTLTDCRDRPNIIRTIVVSSLACECIIYDIQLRCLSIGFCARRSVTIVTRYIADQAGWRGTQVIGITERASAYSRLLCCVVVLQNRPGKPCLSTGMKTEIGTSFTCGVFLIKAHHALCSRPSISEAGTKDLWTMALEERDRNEEERRRSKQRTHESHVVL